MKLDEMRKMILTPHLSLSLGIKNKETGKEYAQKDIVADCNLCLWKIALIIGGLMIGLCSFFCVWRSRAKKARNKTLICKMKKYRDNWMKKMAH